MYVPCGKYRIYPRIGRTLFQGKNVQNLGCGLYAVTRVLSSLICKISRHTQSQQSYWMLDSLIECIVWGQVNPCRPSDRVREKNWNCAGFWGQIVQEKTSIVRGIVRDCVILWRTKYSISSVLARPDREEILYKWKIRLNFFLWR